MNALDEIVILAPPLESEAVPQPWYRTVYEDKSEDRITAFFGIGSRLTDLALGLQIQAMNATLQTAVSGVRAASNVAREVAHRLGVVPGASFAADLAGRIGARAHDLGEDARQIVEKTATAGSEAGMTRKLAADMVLGPGLEAASFPVTTTLDAALAGYGTPPGKAAAGTALAALNSTLDQLSVSSSPTILDTARVRDSFLAMTTGSGGTAIRNIFNTGLAVARLGLGDTRPLGEALADASVSFEYGVKYSVDSLLYPKVPVGVLLAEVSLLIVRYLPVTWISALRTGDLWKTLNAGVEDGENVALSTMLFPTGYALAFINIGRYLATGLRDINDIDEFIRRETEIVQKFPELGTIEGINTLLVLGPEDANKSEAILALIQLEKKRPFTCTEFEYYVGNAKSTTDPDLVATGLRNHSMLPGGVFPQDIINLAQDTAFYYSDKILGREAALIRMLRLFGPKVQARLAADVSLETDAGLDAAQIGVLIHKHADAPEKLDEISEMAKEKVRSFDRLSAMKDVKPPAHVLRRRQFYQDLIQSIDEHQRPRGPVAVPSQSRQASA